jgi:tryptophan synthase beta subunit
VRDFQACIGEETRAQMLEQAGRLPDVVVRRRAARVGSLHFITP